MAYGFETFNANQDKIIDSEATTMLQVASVETWANNTSKTRNAGEIFLINFNNPASPGEVAWLQFSTSGANNNIYNFSGLFNNGAGSTGSLSLARLVEVASDSSPPDSSDYGLEIYNSGSTTIYNGNYTKAFDIVDWIPKGEVDGVTAPYSTGGASNRLNSSPAGSNLYFTLPRPVTKSYSDGFNNTFVIRENQFNIDTNNDIILIAYTETSFSGTSSRSNRSAMFTAQIRN